MTTPTKIKPKQLEKVGHIIKDDGVPLTQRTYINFTTPGVAVDNAVDDSTDVGAGSGSGSPASKVLLYQNFT